VIAMSGLAFDLSTPHGRMLATVLAGIAVFERERVRSGMANQCAERGGARDKLFPCGPACLGSLKTPVEGLGETHRGRMKVNLDLLSTIRGEAGHRTR
jgi:hypothetical protein